MHVYAQSCPGKVCYQKNVQENVFQLRLKFFIYFLTPPLKIPKCPIHMRLKIYINLNAAQLAAQALLLISSELNHMFTDSEKYTSVSDCRTFIISGYILIRTNKRYPVKLINYVKCCACSIFNLFYDKHLQKLI